MVQATLCQQCTVIADSPSLSQIEIGLFRYRLMSWTAFMLLIFYVNQNEMRLKHICMILFTVTGPNSEVHYVMQK